MCGIGGISFHEPVSATRAANHATALLRGLTPRGKDAHGVAYMIGGKVHTFKAIGPHSAANHSALREAMDEDGAQDRGVEWLMVHTRFATHGDQKEMTNNHPIRHGRVVGVHNGVIYNYASVLKDLGGRQYKRTGVDSEAIFASLDHLGMTPEALETIEGTMAIAAVNTRKAHTLMLAKGNSSPLHLMAGTHGLVFASTQGAAAQVPGYDKDDDFPLYEGRIVRVKKGKIVHMEWFKPAESYARVQRRDWRDYGAGWIWDETYDDHIYRPQERSYQLTPVSGVPRRGWKKSA